MDSYNVNNMGMKTYPMPTDFHKNIKYLMTECYFAKDVVSPWECVEENKHSLSQNNNVKSMR